MEFFDEIRHASITESHLFLLGCFVLVTADRIVGNVEGVVTSRGLRIFSTLYHEPVLLSTNHVDLGNQQAVYIPRDTPANVT